MDRTLIAAIFFLLFGGFLTWSAIKNWQHRDVEKITILEAAILKTTGAEPLPLTKLDRILQWLLLIFATIFGPVLLLVAIIALIDEIGEYL